MPISQINFQLIPFDQVPFHLPVAKLVSNPRGSKWDRVLKALEHEHGKAVKITEPNRVKRNKLKATLQTIAKNRRLFGVKVRADNTAVYAWVSDQIGRFERPQN
jgi:hypothetical protein